MALRQTKNETGGIDLVTKRTQPHVGPDSLLDRAVGVLARFVGSALFGLLISWIVFEVALDLAMTEERTGWIWVALLCGTPVIWGIVGVFYFDKMAEFARTTFESYLGSDPR
jgi:hypothetical protein